MSTHQKCALVTEGAGLIGSHIVDMLLSESWTFAFWTTLSPTTHKFGKPAWVNPAAKPQATTRQGIAHYIDWIKTQGIVEEYLSKAKAGLHAKGIVQNVGR
jgi:hypothetical protein